MRGYLQLFSIDINQTIVAIIKLIAFRVLFAISAYYDLNINQIDIKTAFFYSLIDQFVCVQIPRGSKDATNKGKIDKLLKALYGPKQVPRL